MNGQNGLPIVLAVGVLLLAWYIAGNELMRRRARRLAVWCRDACAPMGSVLTIQWLTINSCRIESRDPVAPFNSVTLTGLTESLDVPVIWLWHRLRGRRDMVLLQCTLRQPIVADLELYRPRSLLAGDSRHLAYQRGWSDEPLEEFCLAPAGSNSQSIARRLLAEMGGERANLIRLAVRRSEARLTLAVNLPEKARCEPAQFYRTVCAVVAQVSRPSTPAS